MPNNNDAEYREELKKLCDNEQDFMTTLAFFTFSQHVDEAILVQSVAKKDKDTMEKTLDDYFESIRQNILGNSQLIMTFMEIYRVLVDEKIIEPVNGLKTAKRINCSPKDIQDLRDLVKRALGQESRTENVLAHPLLTIAGMNGSEENEEQAADDIDDALEAVFDEVVEKHMKKMKKGGKNAR